MSLDAIVTAAASALGPLGAAIAFVWLQRRERARERRLDLFFSMLRVRRLWLSREWVYGLNLVRTEFAQHAQVIEALNKMHDSYADPAWQSMGPSRQRVVIDTDGAGCALLQRMAEALDLELKASDLRNRALTPYGWTADDVQERHLRDLSMQVLIGERALRVDIATPPARAPAAPAQPEAARESVVYPP